MDYQNATVPELRKEIRAHKDIMVDNNISATDTVYLSKDQLISLLNGSGLADKIAAPKKDNGDLAAIIAHAIEGHIDIKSPLNEDRVIELIKENLNIKPIIIKNPETGDIKDIGVQHKIFADILKLVSMRIDLMLVGPAGSGKTTVCESVAEALDLPFYFIPVGLQTTKSDLIGYRDANGNYVGTHLRSAYENGGVFLLDEIDAGNPNVLTVINAMLSNGLASFPDAIVKRHADFVFIAAGNTYGKGADRQYVGRNPIDAATLDRFAVLDFDYDEELEKALCADTKWVSRVQDIRTAVDLLKEKVVVSPRASIKGASALKMGFDRSQVEDMLIFRGVNHEIKNRILAQVEGN